jgi:hypothetical protein
MRSTAEVLPHHVKCFGWRDIDGTFSDYSADAVFFSVEGAVRGLDALRTVFENGSASSPNQARQLRRSNDWSKEITYILSGPQKRRIILMSWQAIPL